MKHLSAELRGARSCIETIKFTLNTNWQPDVRAASLEK